MTSQSAKNRMTLIYVLVVVLTGTISWVLTDPPSSQILPKPNIKGASEKALILSTEMVKLLLSLSTGAIAACAWVITRPGAQAESITERLFLVSTSIILFCLSMYCGFLTLDGSLELLRWGAFDSRSDLVWWPQTLQYYFFLVGVLVFGLAAIRSIHVISDGREMNRWEDASHSQQ